MIDNHGRMYGADQKCDAVNCQKAWACQLHQGGQVFHFCARHASQVIHTDHDGNRSKKAHVTNECVSLTKEA